VCVRRERVVKLVIERCDGLGGNQAELGRKVVRPAFWGSANSLTLVKYHELVKKELNALNWYI
jgi:hypothetical protein